MSSSWLLVNLIIVVHWASSISTIAIPEHCQDERVRELIKSSPVILKALGARIFAEVDLGVWTSLADGHTDRNVVGNNSAEGNHRTTIATRTTVTSWLSSSSSSSLESSKLITLTPTTIYKGASLLKILPTVDGGEYYHYEGQINATVDPLRLPCLESKDDNNILNVLPAELIVFGKLDGNQTDILQISTNGLHRWTARFENDIWKNLGWDDWSDFTSCSVMCGKGVQQRFRRCLLDNPNADITAGGRMEFYHSSSPGVRINTREQNNKQQHPYKKYAGGIEKRLKKRRKKKSKILSTQSCEGYNIEQRNCNMFECSDEITDMLKFYKRSSGEDNATAQVRSMVTTQQTTLNLTTTSTNVPTSPSDLFFRNWDNFLNFTIMLTIRMKTKLQTTIFSLRNSTHNLYIESGRDSLKLFQERNDATEMLPIKFNLYDNHWHQVAISVHNGDFITIYVDCLWTDSFIVSKGLFVLPDAADVEVAGHNFNGDIQQLLVMPGNHEKSQCSNLRTSINEVKRYIIDTLIEDDIN